MAYENMKKFVRLLRYNQEADLDVIVAVTGRKGTGKTSFSIQCVREYIREYFGESSLDIRKYMAYDNDEVLDKVFNLPEYSPIIADEASRFAMGEDWNKAESKEMKKIMAQVRTRHLIVFLCLPEFLWLDKKYRDDMVTHWAWIPTREHSMIFEPNDNPGEPDVWDLKKFAKAGYLSKWTPIEKIVRVVSKNKCFKFDVQFPKVPAPLYERYLKLRDQKILEEKGQDYVSQKDVAKVMAWNLKHRWDEIADDVELGRFDKPTYKMMSDRLLIDPRTSSIIAGGSTVRNWVLEVDKSLPKKRVMEEDADEEVELESGMEAEASE